MRKNTNLLAMVDKMVYTVGYKIDNNDTDYIYLELNLYRGWDYISPDDNDIQGWCTSDNFIDEVQNENFICYIINESIKECLTDNGYVLVGKEKMTEMEQIAQF